MTFLERGQPLMTLFVSKDESQSSDKPESESTVESQVFIGMKPVLKNWKLFGEDGVANEDRPEAAHAEDDAAQADVGANEPIMPVLNVGKKLTARRIRHTAPVAPFWLQIGQALAVFVTVAWVTYAAFYILALPGSIKAITSSPLTLGGIIASVLAPVAMLWLCIATWQRRSDAHIYAQALKEELRDMLFPSEEQSRLVGEDIQMLMRQATEMSASSRAAVKAIQRARAGLRTEIRDFAGVSQKAEFHIDRLADTLGKRSEEMLSMMELMEKQTDQINVKAAQGIQSWENVSEEISELGKEIDDIFEAGSQKITGASAKAADQASKIEGTLAGAAENLSLRINAVATQIEEAQGRIDSDSKRLEEAAYNVLAGADQISQSLDGAERIAGAVESVMSVIEESLTKVEKTSNDLTERTGNIEQKLAERADNLKQSAVELLESTNELEKVGEMATHKLGEALTMALSGADTISASVRRSKDMIDKSIEDASLHIEETSAKAESRLEMVVRSVKVNRDEIAELLGEMETRNEALDRTAERLESQRSRMVESIEKASVALDRTAADLSERAKEPVELIARSVDRLGVQTQDLDDRLSVRIVELEQSQNKLRDTIDTVTVTLKTSLQDTSSVTGQIISQTRTINDEIDTQKTSLTALVDELERRTGEIVEYFKVQNQELSDSLNISETQIGLLGTSLYDRGSEIISQVSGMSTDISGVENRIIEALEHIEAKTDNAQSMLEGNASRLEVLAEQIGPSCEQMVVAAEALEAKYAALRESYISSTETAAECITDLGQQLDERLERLSNGVMEGSRSMLAMSEDLGGTMIEIRQVAEDAQDKLSQVQLGVKGRIDDLQLVTDQVKSKVELLQKNLDVYITDIAGVVGKATSDLQEATDLFGQSTTALDHKVDSTNRKLIENIKLYVEEGQRISLVSEQTTHKTSRIVSSVREETAKLVDSVNQALLDLQKSGETLSVRTQEIEAYLRSNTEKAGQYTEELRKQATTVAATSMDVVDQIAEATSKLTSRASEVRQSGMQITDNLELSREKLSDESTRMAAVTRKAMEAAEEAAGVFTRQSAALYRSVQEIADQAKKLKDTQLRSEREAFLAASKFVIESLYSLAVDVSRHLEEEIDARVLRAYQKGDVASFARHLVEIAYRIPLERSQKKFIEDSEFRTYVLRFIRQYEEVLQQAQSNDHGELLVSLFSTSDIGKLYKILCEIAGRSAKIH